jgi:hypothetical protein
MAILRPSTFVRPVSLLLAVLVAVLVTAMPRAAQPDLATQDLETEVRAVYLYNFARYVEWPASAFPEAGTPIRICVQAPDAFFGALERAVAGETVNGRRLEAVRALPGSSRRTCHLLYVAESGGRLAAALSAVRGRPVLTVGEDDRFFDLGGMIRFRRVDNRVRFDINLTSLQRSGLQVTARLLGVASAVRRESQP